MGLNGIGTVCEEKAYDNEYLDRQRFVDDVTEKPFDAKLVRAARADEIKRD